MNRLNFLSSVVGNGIEGRKSDNQRAIIRYLSKAEEPITIPEIASFLDISIPIATKFVKELVKLDLIVEEGKRVSENGRRPKAYSLNRTRFYVVGVEILSKFIHISILSSDFETIHESADRDFVLDYSPSCLQFITHFIQNSIQESNINKSNIIGIGIGVTSSGNFQTNGQVAYFKESEISLEDHLIGVLKIPVLIDIDTRCISVAEQSLGLAKGINNALVVKVSRSLGMGIIIAKHIVKGQQGFAGSFNHMKFGNANRPCHCGKIGCLGTLIGGDALLLDLELALASGKQSFYFKKELLGTYGYHDILDAVLKGDELSINILQNQGNILGQSLGNISNLLDPESVIIGGEFTMVKDFFINAVNIGMGKTALVEVHSNCKIEASTLGRYLGSKAGACIVLKAAEMIEY